MTKFSDNIISIKTKGIYKTFTILGLKFKFKSNKQIINKLNNKIKKLETFIEVQDNYSIVLERLRKKFGKKKINVIFIVAENSKWGYQSLYELFEKSENFEPKVLITILTSVHNGIDKTRKNIEEHYNFFKSRNMNVDYLYKNGEYLDLEIFNPDIVFYEQPWDLPDKHMPKQVSKFAITMFCPYAYAILDDLHVYYNNKFHSFLFRYYIEHELNLEFYKNFDKNADKICKIVGYPKLDNLMTSSKYSSVWKEQDKIKIIYAPHHSFDKSLKLATFHKNNQFILNLAKQHPETTWIFKPHPRFKFAVLKVGIMNEEEINKYYDEWAKIGAVYTQGDYRDIFHSSDGMITDCASFLAEYLLTKKPLIRLKSSEGVGYNKLGEKILSENYEVADNKTLEKTFNEVIINKNDFKYEKRIKMINEIVDKNTSASQKILNDINSLLTK